MSTSERTPGEDARKVTTRPATVDDLAEVRALMIRTFDEDFGYGYNPAFHADVDDPQGVYLDNPRHILFVAVEPATGQILGTAGIRSGGLKPAFNEPWLVARYDPERTAQIVRVYTLREARGRGVARARAPRGGGGGLRRDRAAHRSALAGGRAFLALDADDADSR